jgi:hypothetical protein
MKGQVVGRSDDALTNTFGKEKGIGKGDKDIYYARASSHFDGSSPSIYVLIPFSVLTPFSD